jgi:xanthine dehydrogenase molybdenum-binding subunit
MAQQNNRGLSVVGTAGPPIDALERVTGQAKYVGDLEVPGMLVARVLRTRHAHARIVSIDTRRAEALAGVKAVITYQDAPKVPIWGNRTLALNDRVRFAGEAVAAVAAVDDDTAERALRLIDVQYEVLKFVLDPEAALKEGAPQLFPDGNLEGEPRRLTRGDVERGFAECDRVLERVYHCPTMWSGGMEPRVAIAQWEGSKLTVWASTQAPCRVLTNLTGQFNVADSQVRVIASYVGGGFGTKSAAHVDETIAALLARKARRPVKLQYSREEEILDSNTRFETRVYVKIGVKRDMTLHALDVRAYINQGAYHVRLGGLGNQASHIYNIPHLRTLQYRVHTNLPNTGPTRGVGDPQETFAIDSAIDEIANEMGWDPVAFRLKNVKRSGDPIARGGVGTEDGRLVTQVTDRCIEDGAARIGWARRNAAPGAGQAGPKARGIGVAVTERGNGGGLAGATVTVNLDGSVVVFYASTDIGTHSRTTLSMIAAETLGVPLASLRAVAGDTEVAPYDGGSYGNRVLYSTGRAVDAAARDCLGQILATAAPMLKAASGDLELRNGVVRVKSDTSRSLPLKEVMTRRGRSIVGDGSVAQSQAEMNVERAAGAHFVEVEVDRETGKIRILTYISAHDVGQPINITVVENQIEGGTIQGLALTQAEEMRFDPRDGRCLNANFLDLKPPTMLDFDPRVIESVVIDNVGEQGPYGAKGLGENPCHPGMAAVANAIYNAVGIRLRRVPFTRADVLRALAEPRSVPSRTATGPAEAGQDVRGVRL